MDKQCEKKSKKDSNKDRRRKYTSIPFVQHWKKYLIDNRRAYVDTGLKNTLLLITDCRSKWIDACKRQTYILKDDKKKKKDHPDPKRLPKKNRLQQLQTYNVPTYDMKNTNGTN